MRQHVSKCVNYFGAVLKHAHFYEEFVRIYAKARWQWLCRAQVELNDGVVNIQWLENSNHWIFFALNA